MPFEFICPHCGQSNGSLPDELKGTSGAYNSCNKAVTFTTRTRRKSRLRSCCLVSAVLSVGLFALALVFAIPAGIEAGRRMTCAANLKMIALGLHNYHDRYGSFPPPYTVDAEGNRLHSWRTLLLPYMGRSDVYGRIDLSKPWNAAENAFALQIAIPGYCCPSSEHGGKGSCAAQYVVVVGDGLMFDENQCVSLKDMNDKRDETLLVVESANRSTSWMEPTDLEFKSMQFKINGGPSEISSVHPGGATVVMASGSVLFVSQTCEPDALKASFTRDGAEPNPLRFE
jgi:hypothetical protein